MRYYIHYLDILALSEQELRAASANNACLKIRGYTDVPLLCETQGRTYKHLECTVNGFVSAITIQGKTYLGWEGVVTIAKNGDSKRYVYRAQIPVLPDWPDEKHDFGVFTLDRVCV